MATTLCPAVRSLRRSAVVSLAAKLFGGDAATAGPFTQLRSNWTAAAPDGPVTLGRTHPLPPSRGTNGRGNSALRCQVADQTVYHEQLPKARGRTS